MHGATEQEAAERIGTGPGPGAHPDGHPDGTGPGAPIEWEDGLFLEAFPPGGPAVAALLATGLPLARPPRPAETQAQAQAQTETGTGTVAAPAPAPPAAPAPPEGPTPPEDGPAAEGSVVPSTGEARGGDEPPGDPPPAPPKGGPRPRSPLPVRSLTRYLAVGLLGVAAMLGGLVWDAVVHARDPGAEHAEGTLFSFSNRSHALLVAGGALAVLGLAGATIRALSMSAGRRLSSSSARAFVVVATTMAVATTGGAVQWASTAQPPLASGPLAPDPGPDVHGIGVVNSHAPGECRPTAAERQGAAKLVADTEVGTARYRSLAAALADGYEGPPNPTVTEHYTKASYTRDGRVLDPTRPESLMYTPTARGPVLVGAMYFVNVPGEYGPEPGGCLTRWHVHDNFCFSPANWEIATVMSSPGETCPAGQVPLVPPAALHVWFVDVPGGRFAAEVDPAYLARAVGP